MIDSFWPRWLAKDIPGLAVWTLAYEAPPSNWFGTAMPIQDRAKNVLECLIGERELRGLPLIFVCHSLGGLLIKQILRAADGRRAYGDAEARSLCRVGQGHCLPCHAAFRIGARHPARQAAADRLAVRVDPRPRQEQCQFARPQRLVSQLVWPIRHKVFYEKQGTSAGIIVADDSSDPGLLHVDPVGIDADHRTICKPDGARDLVYSRTRDFIADTVGVGLARAGTTARYRRSICPHCRGNDRTELSRSLCVWRSF